MGDLSIPPIAPLELTVLFEYHCHQCSRPGRDGEWWMHWMRANFLASLLPDAPARAKHERRILKIFWAAIDAANRDAACGS